MYKHKYLIGLLFVVILFFPFKVNGEELTERVTIFFQDGIDTEILKDPSIEIHHIFAEYNAVSVSIPASMKDSLKAHSSIRFIERDPEVKTTSQIMSWGYQSLAVQTAAKSGFTGKGVRIGILDTGVRLDHPDLHLSGGVTFVQGTSSPNDDNGHGTHVAGIIAAQNNEIGSVGVAPEAQIYAVKVLDRNGEGNQSDVAAGINWAMEQGLDLINLSITSPSGSFLLEETLQKAYDRGILIVAASGNYPSSYNEQINVLYPARYSTVIAVGSVDEKQVRSSFSYYGSDLEFVAPGEKIYSTMNGSGNEAYGFSTGTSMAAPFVTGMAALYKQSYPELSPSGIRTYMQKSTLDLGSKGKDDEYGFGLVQPPSNKEVSIFPDVPVDSWYETEVNDMFLNGIISGYRDGNFYPNHTITRAEAMAMIGRVKKFSGEKSITAFSDVPYDHFASGYIRRAVEEGIISGYPDKTFKPGSQIIRGDVAVILQQTFDLPESSGPSFLDVDAENRYYNSVNSLAAFNITKGHPDGTFKPYLNITRAEFSVLLSKTIAEWSK